MTKRKCVHHYVLEESAGEKCRGVCKLCGKVKIHKQNRVPVMDRDMYRNTLHLAVRQQSIKQDGRTIYV